jgi:hypothetical protein
VKLAGHGKMGLNETYSKVCTGEHFFDAFLFHNGLQKGGGLLPLLVKFALECAIRKVQENRGIETECHMSFWSVLMTLIYWVRA